MAGLNFDRLKQRLLPSTLFGRSLMIIALPILILQMSVAFFFFDRHWDSTTDKLVFALTGEIKIATEQLRDARDRQQEKRIIDTVRDLALTLSVEPLDRALLAKRGGRLGRLYWFNIGDRLRAELEKKIGKDFVVLQNSESHKLFEIVVKIDDSRMARFISPERRLTGPATYAFLLWVIASAAILFGIAIIFMRNQIRPIMRLALAADKLGKGQDVPDFKPVGAAEVRKASQAFMMMKDRLKRQIEQRTAMLAGVSHDLRTPLTRMKLQMAISKPTQDIENLRQDIEEMERMIEGYLTFARGEGDEGSENADLLPMIERIAQNARRQGYAVDTTGVLPVTIKARPRALERAISNVILNACKYGKNAWICSAGDDTGVTVTIDDDGPGIPAAMREEVFKPFFRLERSRNKKTGGIGLGLSIAQDIVHSHGGEIGLADSPHGGLRVTIRLPL